MNGHAVQLVGGDPTKLKVDAGDPLPLALKYVLQLFSSSPPSPPPSHNQHGNDAHCRYYYRFRLAGEIAVVDLDAALGTGDNSLIIKQLLKVGYS